MGQQEIGLCLGADQNARDMQDLPEGVVRGPFYSCSSAKRMSCRCKSSIWKGSWFLPGWRSRAASPALAGQEFIVPGLLGVCVSGLRVSPAAASRVQHGVNWGEEGVCRCGGFFPTSALTA